jgi:hypothetical protein
MSKELTPEQIEAGKEYLKQKRREYWQRMPEEERKERHRAAYKRFWEKMTPEQRRQKRLEYAAATAARKAAQSDAE